MVAISLGLHLDLYFILKNSRFIRLSIKTAFYRLQGKFQVVFMGKISSSWHGHHTINVIIIIASYMP